VAQMKLMILVDENMSKAISDQLKTHGVDASRATEHIAEGASDDDLLEYAYQNGYSLVTHDKRIQSHIDKRFEDGKEHCGVFIAPEKTQGPHGIGQVVNFIVEYDTLIKGGAATLQDDVYNQTIYIE
jgi:hypothetical protein